MERKETASEIYERVLKERKMARQREIQEDLEMFEYSPLFQEILDRLDKIEKKQNESFWGRIFGKKKNE